MVLLLDRDVGEQMVVLFAQEREEIHLREYVGDFAQVFPAEVRNNAAGGRVPQRGIQKAVESYRITPEQKDELRSLRWKDCAKEEGV